MPLEFTHFYTFRNPLPILFQTTLKNKSDELQKANLANFNLEHRIAELEPLKENVALLKEDNAVYAAEINGLKQTLEEAHKTLKIKESENASLKQNIGSQVSETDSLVKKLEQMRFERDECKALEKDLREVQVNLIFTRAFLKANFHL